jgi:hypothetical protein
MMWLICQLRGRTISTAQFAGCAQKRNIEKRQQPSQPYAHGCA